MEYTLQEKYDMIKSAVLGCDDKDPVKIARLVMDEEYVNMHGPEHHFLDGAAFLMAYRNAGGAIDAEGAAQLLQSRAADYLGGLN